MKEMIVISYLGQLSMIKGGYNNYVSIGVAANSEKVVINNHSVGGVPVRPFLVYCLQGTPACNRVIVPPLGFVTLLL
jgi:hypothetical protein